MVRRNPDDAPLQVRKRDGRAMPFDPARLLVSLQRALRDAGRDEEALARDLRGVLETYVRDHAEAGQVCADELAELAQQVLRGAGCEAAAVAYANARDQRAHARGLLRIRATAAHDPVRGIPPAGRHSRLPDAGPSNEGPGSAGVQDTGSAGSAWEAGASPGGGDTGARGPEDPEAWSKGRVAALLAHAADLPAGIADAIASEVERSLFASGLRSIGAALLREWIDNELVLRGFPPRLGQHRFVGLAPHELRGILAEGAVGLGAEAEVSRRLFTRYALGEVYPADVRAAHEQGLLGLENLASGGRLDSLVLAPWRLPALGAPGAVASQRLRLRALGPLLRTLEQFVSRELLLDWDGPALAAQPLADLLVHLADLLPTPGAGARLVFCVPADRPGLAAGFLAALESLRGSPLPRAARLPCVRLPAARLTPELLAQALRLEDVDGRLQFACGAPRPGIVSASVAINVGRLAWAAGPRGVHDFLQSLQAAVGLALSALGAQEALLNDGAAPLRALRRTAGLPSDALPRRHRLALCGVGEAARVLLGDGPRGRANRADLAAAIGERLAAQLAGRCPEVTVGLPVPATAERFGRLDLQAFPAGRDLLPLCGQRLGYRYDGALVLAPGADGAEAGAEAGRFWQRLGLDAEGPVPRCTGSADQRRAFLPAFLSVTSPVPDLHPCG